MARSLRATRLVKIFIPWLPGRLVPKNPSPVLFHFISEGPKPDSFFRNLCPSVNSDIDKIESNWRSGRFKLEKINCQSENSKGVYCLQYDDDKIVSGLRDNTIKLWDRKTLECRATLTGHTGSVLCLQEWFKSFRQSANGPRIPDWLPMTIRTADLNRLISIMKMW